MSHWKIAAHLPNFLPLFCRFPPPAFPPVGTFTTTKSTLALPGSRVEGWKAARATMSVLTPILYYGAPLKREGFAFFLFPLGMKYGGKIVETGRWDLKMIENC